jgi:hypothetical protein
MKKDIISKEEFDELMSLEGEIRGSVVKNAVEFTVKEKGEKALKKIEGVMKNLDYPTKYREMDSTTFYPLGLEAITLLMIKRLFNFDDKKFQELGEYELKSSLMIRIFTKYFGSIDRIVKMLPKIWEKHFSVGKLTVVDYSMEKRRGTVKIENFRLHPLYCQHLIGVFGTALRMVLKTPVICEEIKCIHRGDEYHEFSFSW